jgi:hypothetical protein
MESKILQRTKSNARREFEHTTYQTQSDEEEGPKKVDLVRFLIVTFRSIVICDDFCECELHGHLFNKE